MSEKQWAVVLPSIDNILLNNYWRKYYTYSTLGWDEVSIRNYLSQKENIMKIASFNTIDVSFSASSRRNRYYEIYNKSDMLDHDALYEGAIEGLKKLNSLYKIYILSTRTVLLKEDTLKKMKALGIDLEFLDITFKGEHDKLDHFKRKQMKEIKEKYAGGVGICMAPGDLAIYERFGYTPVCFLSVKNREDFLVVDPNLQVFLNNWPELLQALNVA